MIYMGFGLDVDDVSPGIGRPCALSVNDNCVGLSLSQEAIGDLIVQLEPPTNEDCQYGAQTLWILAQEFKVRK
jgi:hypothetical protein